MTSAGEFEAALASALPVVQAQQATQATLQATQSVKVAGVQILWMQQPAIAAAAGGVVVDIQARAAIASILAALRAHGLVAT